MTISFTYVKESYLFSKRTFIFPGMLESSSQASNLEPVWTMQTQDRDSTMCAGRDGPSIMSARMEGHRRDLAQFTYQGKMTSGGFDGTKSTWTFIDFDGKRYDWIAGMMQNCWKLEDESGQTVAQYIGMSRDYKVKGTVNFHTKVNEALIALIILSTRMLKYDNSNMH
ncbi:hypothetical protein BX661DRAFT_172280 [Kickxella alabastrina]|uniref:uncharacterized protein n=1 Tax=Kickxella alabastrina TaxID=61397 RepID=UPI00222028F8|nr:uncharacterized protein BX661DRAFT_172280 [Kickxella alabastrina]KAI7824443.1 hypothetical protein BX661DRAFT_172280 [Kickxella alabastrina]KAJ1938806.1 hypothetical protein GGF37_004661 [Kickxella alabastrina]